MPGLRMDQVQLARHLARVLFGGDTMTTAVAATPTPPTPVKACNLAPEVFQDILYEILANGLDPREARVTSAQIEHFLFEHARAPKSSEAFFEFFKKYELSTNPDDHLKPIDLKGLRLPDQATANAPPAHIVIEPMVSNDNTANSEPMVSNDNAANSEPTSPKINAAALSRAVQTEPTCEPVIVQQIHTKGPGTRTVWAAAAGIVILLGIGAGLGFAIANLHGEVAQAKTAQRQSQQTVLELQQRISGLQSEVVRNGQSVERLQPQLDLLVETIAPPPPAQSSQPAK